MEMVATPIVSNSNTGVGGFEKHLRPPHDSCKSFDRNTQFGHDSVALQRSHYYWYRVLRQRGSPSATSTSPVLFCSSPHSHLGFPRNQPQSPIRYYIVRAGVIIGPYVLRRILLYV